MSECYIVGCFINMVIGLMFTNVLIVGGIGKLSVTVATSTIRRDLCQQEGKI